MNRYDGRPFPLLLAALAGALVLTLTIPLRGEVAVTQEEIEEALETEENVLRVTRVVEGLAHPWAIGWLPDGRMLVTERAGRLHLIDLEEESATDLEGLPRTEPDEDQENESDEEGQGGLLDIAVHPDYETNGWIYLTYSSPGDDDSVIGDEGHGTGTALARARLSEDESELVDMEILYTQVPRWTPGRHYGSRIVFPGDGTVIFSIGDRGLRFVSQDLTDPGGSMIRLREDGGAPEENPFVGIPPGNLRPEIFSFGHRNNQGLAIDPDGEIWATDHGPSGGDLLYRVRKGANYGWPQVAFGTEYSTGEPIGIGTEAPGVERPAHVWDGSLAPSGLAVYSGEHFPEWLGNLFAGFLAGERLIRLVLDDDGAVVHEEVLLQETVGRIRDVRQGPDGYLYVATDEEDGGIYRIAPAGAGDSP